MSKNILIIEDEEDIRSVYAEILKDAGYVVSEAADGVNGLAMAQQGSWDILLLDIMLPGEDGMQLLREIKKNDALKQKPIILLTNLENDTIITQCFELGASGYLIKSEITPDKIVAEVAGYLA